MYNGKHLIYSSPCYQGEHLNVTNKQYSVKLFGVFIFLKGKKNCGVLRFWKNLLEDSSQCVQC